MRFTTIFFAILLLGISYGTVSAQSSKPAPDTNPPEPAKGVITDYKVHAAPKPPKLPPAGGIFIDPTFHTTILRLTDSRDARDNHNQYSYWPSFNKDSTYLWVACDKDAYLFAFDPDNFRIVNKRKLFRNLPSGVSPIIEDMIWSSIDPNLLFFHDWTSLWSYHVTSGKYTLIKDFSGPLPSSNLWQMSKSDDDNVFAFTRKDSEYQNVGYISWRRNTNKLIRKDRQAIDEVQVDKTGRYLLVKTGMSGKGVVEGQVLDLQTGSIEDLIDSEPDFNPGHSDMGRGIVIGNDNWQNRILRRNLATPHSFTSIFEWPDWHQDNHCSLLAEDEDWLLISAYGGTESEPAGLFWNEIFLVSTDGSKRVRRLAHHHSKARDYSDTPRANISRDGRFVVFTSNWGGTNQRDVFIIKIPQ
jgi:hypothetical protein